MIYRNFNWDRCTFSFAIRKKADYKKNAVASKKLLKLGSWHITWPYARLRSLLVFLEPTELNYLTPHVYMNKVKFPQPHFHRFM